MPSTTSSRIFVVGGNPLNGLLLASILSASGFDAKAMDGCTMDWQAAAPDGADLFLCEENAIDAVLLWRDGQARRGSRHGREGCSSQVVALRAGEGSCRRAPRPDVDAMIVLDSTAADFGAAVGRVLEAAASPAVGVWSRAPFDDLSRRLGDERLRRFLAGFSDRLAGVAGMLASTPRHAIVAALHDLRSIAGMMGFVEVLEGCTAIQSADPSEREGGWRLLPGAIARAASAVDAFLGRDGEEPASASKAEAA